jgi:D-psicose/D-tagatose/L-ribulose 3-epimerase
MKLAVSNIAWGEEWDCAAFGFLAVNGISGIEVAPTRVWPHWQGISPRSIQEFRDVANSAGLSISSLQAILFHKPELQLFGSNQDRQAMHEHLCRCADLAADLGAGCLVFGAPKNRDRGALSEEEALSIAAHFFAKVAEYYAERGVCLAFEANPVEYACNFAVNSRTASRLVRMVDSPGLRLHLDTACLQLAGECAVEVIEQNADILGHFHVSEPYLGPFSSPAISHSRVANALKNADYDAWAALEMRAGEPPLPALEQATRYLRRTYGDKG